MSRAGDGAADRTLVAALERVGHALRVQLRAHAARAGLSVMQAQLLMRITAAEDAQRHSSQLAEWFDVRLPTVTDSVTALVRKGLVERRPVKGDGRRFRLHATRRGEQVAQQLEHWDADIRAELEALQTPANGLTIDGLLQLIGRLQHAGVITVARTCATCRFFRPEEHPGTQTPHHCALLDEPLGPATLRLDCPDHQTA